MGVFSRMWIFSTGASCFLNQNHPSSNMKAFVAMFAAVAAAAAEPYYGLYGAPLVYGIGKSAPCVNAANVPVPCAHLGKREAEADPALVYSVGAAAHAVLPAVHTIAAPAVYHVPAVHTVAEPCMNVNGEAVPCAAGHPEYHRAYNVIAKRDAESDPTLYFVNPVGHRYEFPHNGFGQELVHSSNFGICTNYLGQQVAC